MIIVVNKANNVIQATYDAWEMNSYASALDDIKGNGAKLVDERINLNGDMILVIEYL